MEKKVLLKDLVDSGSHIRKQITSKVRVSDQGVYPIGEIWDANTVVDVIINGAHEQHDTLRELDRLAHDTLNSLNAEIARAEIAEHNLDESKADKATTIAGYGITDAYTKQEVLNLIQLLTNTITILTAQLETIQTQVSDIESEVEDIKENGVVISDSVGSDQIVDGSISLDDLSQEVKDQMQATVHEDDENVVFPG